MHCFSLVVYVMNSLKINRLCLVNTLLSCEECDEHFEKKSGLKGCVWSLHCCLVKYVMNILKWTHHYWSERPVYDWVSKAVSGEKSGRHKSLLETPVATRTWTFPSPSQRSVADSSIR